MREPRGVRAGGLRDRAVLRHGADRGAHGALLEEPPDRTHARRPGERDDRRRRRRVSVRADRSGRRRPDRGGHRGGDVPDASQAWCSPHADARPARRRACPGRATGAAVGVRGHDLRPLRLRDGLAVRRPLDPEGVLRVRSPSPARGHPAHRRRGRGAHALPARLGQGAQAHSRDARALAQLVGAPHPLRAARRRERGRPQALRRARRRTAARRATPCTGTR